MCLPRRHLAAVTFPLVSIEPLEAHPYRYGHRVCVCLCLCTHQHMYREKVNYHLPPTLSKRHGIQTGRPLLARSRRCSQLPYSFHNQWNGVWKKTSVAKLGLLIITDVISRHCVCVLLNVLFRLTKRFVSKSFNNIRTCCVHWLMNMRRVVARRSDDLPTV